MNSDSNNDIFTLSDGQQLDLSQLPDKINLRANVNPEEVGSIRFDFNGKNYYRTENVPPYALAGDNNGNYLFKFELVITISLLHHLQKKMVKEILVNHCL